MQALEAQGQWFDGLSRQEKRGTFTETSQMEKP